VCTLGFYQKANELFCGCKDSDFAAANEEAGTFENSAIRIGFGFPVVNRQWYFLGA